MICPGRLPALKETTHMVSHSDNSEQEFDDWASAHGSLLPWSDDQTTATYQLSQLSDLQQFARANARPRSTAAASDLQDLSWSDTGSEWDPAPIILEETALPPARATQAVRAPARPGPHQSRPAPPRNSGFEKRAAGASPQRSAPLSRARPSPRPAIAPPQAYLPAASSAYDEEEENPFASPHRNLTAWLLATLAAAGLFSGVLFGRMLLRTSMPEAAPLPQATQVRVVEPVASTLVATPAPELGSEPPAAAAEPTSTRKPSQGRAKYARVSREGSEWNLEPLERVASQPDKPSASVSRQDEAGARSSDSAEPDASPVSADEPGAQATLRINSRPWSQVFVDGQLVGTTPLLGVSVTAGKHAVRLVNPEFDMAKTFTVNVAPGESLTRIEMLQN
jgi:hypothetical protein